MEDKDYPATALAYSWVDKAFEKEHLIELVGEAFVINEVKIYPGIRVAAGESGVYRAERLVPLTRAAREFLNA